MDQNQPRDEVSGAQPPAEPGSSDQSGWNQTNPAAAPNQPQAGGGQEAAAEHAAWSADATYQQQQAQAAQQQATQPAPPDTQAYVAPEQQAAPTDQQQYAQQQQYQQPQQQAYDPAAYQQQQPQYYDPAAYQQQQQQPQYYDPAAYQQQPPQQQPPQYYDQSAYGQQPGYYDQSAYGQQPQQYQQPPQGYPQQPGQPYAYAQPGQEQQAEQAAGGYNRSFIAVLAGWALMTMGIVFAVIGVIVLWFDSITDLIPENAQLSQEMQDLVATAEDSIFAVGALGLIIGIIHIIAAVGVFGHRKWGRAFAIVLGLIGVIIGIAAAIVAVGFEAIDVGLSEAMKGEEVSLAGSLIVLAIYGFILLAMFVGRRHFKKKGVEA